jgi:iron complex outermembrane receptor protein
MKTYLGHNFVKVFVSAIGCFFLMFPQAGMSATLYSLQESSGTVSGHVTDPAGAVISGANVTASHTQTRQRQRTLTDSQGNFVLTNLAPGFYRVEITAAGFALATKEARIASGESATLDFQLAVGSVKESVIATVDSYEVIAAATGTKTDTPILEIPQSIQVIPQQVIEDQKPLTLSGILRNVSGFSQTRTDFEVFRSFKLRGFDVLDTTTDGIRNTDSLNIQPDGLANIERVEVLKGPASALYGRGAIGGGINIVTKKPLSDSHRQISFNLGSFNHIQGGIDLTGPLNESKSIRYRFTGDYERRDSFIDFFELNAVQIAPGLQFDLGSDTTLTLQSDYRYRRSPRYLGLPLYGSITGTDDIKLPFDRFLSEPGLDDTKNTGLQSTALLNHSFSTNWNAQAAFRWTQNSFFQPTASPRTLQSDNRTLNRGFNLFDERERESAIEGHTTGTIRWGSTEHKLTAGLDYAWWQYDSKFFLGSIAPINIENPVYGAQPTGVFLLADTRDIISSYGFFFQDQITLLPWLTAVVGGRFDKIKNENTDFAIPVSGERDDSQFSPRLGLVVDVAPKVSVYGSYSTSIHPNYGEAFANPLSQPFRPQRGEQYEGGVKFDISTRLFGTVAAYHITQKDVLVDDPDDPTGFFLIQTGKQRSRGLEADLVWSPLNGLDLLTSYAYTDAEIIEDTEPTFIGNRLKNVPRHSGRVWGKYEFRVGDESSIGFGTGVTFTSDLPGDVGNTFEVPGYGVADVMGFFRHKQVTFRVNVNNLFDNEYFHRAAFGSQGIILGEPLRAVASIGIRF